MEQILALAEWGRFLGSPAICSAHYTEKVSDALWIILIIENS